MLYSDSNPPNTVSNSILNTRFRTCCCASFGTQVGAIGETNRVRGKHPS